jgi:hypothetical protein
VRAVDDLEIEVAVEVVVEEGRALVEDRVEQDPGRRAHERREERHAGRAAILVAGAVRIGVRIAVAVDVGELRALGTVDVARDAEAARLGVLREAVGAARAGGPEVLEELVAAAAGAHVVGIGGEPQIQVAVLVDVAPAEGLAEHAAAQAVVEDRRVARDLLEGSGAVEAVE